MRVFKTFIVDSIRRILGIQSPSKIWLNAAKNL